MTPDDQKTIDTMDLMGGSFVRGLAYCARHADQTNLIKLKETFSDYFDKYEAIWRRNEEG